MKLALPMVNPLNLIPQAFNGLPKKMQAIVFEFQRRKILINH